MPQQFIDGVSLGVDHSKLQTCVWMVLVLFMSLELTLPRTCSPSAPARRSRNSSPTLTPSGQLTKTHATRARSTLLHQGAGTALQPAKYGKEGRASLPHPHTIWQLSGQASSPVLLLLSWLHKHPSSRFSCLPF